MTWPWSELKLEPTDDTRTIKRAYAKQLKQTRPDEDPEAFQALYESYQAALDIARLGEDVVFETPLVNISKTTIQSVADSTLSSSPLDTAPEPDLRFINDLYDLLQLDQPFSDTTSWDSLFEHHPLDDLRSHQQASIGAFAQLCEFGWDNRKQLQTRGEFRDLLRRFDDRFDWSNQELALLEMFPEEPAENLLGHLQYNAPARTREPIAVTDEFEIPIWGWLSLSVVFVVLWLIAGVQ